MSSRLEKATLWIMVGVFSAILLFPYYSIFTFGPTSHLGKWTPRCRANHACENIWVGFLSDKICRTVSPSEDLICTPASYKLEGDETLVIDSSGEIRFRLRLEGDTLVDSTGRVLMFYRGPVGDLEDSCAGDVTHCPRA